MFPFSLIRCNGQEAGQQVVRGQDETKERSAGGPMVKFTSQATYQHVFINKTVK
jgi:hypothetical protein